MWRGLGYEWWMATAFKEWRGVCGLLLAGRTSLLLRKGGIHEGRDGFSFHAERFFLFPTSFHEESGGLRVAAPDFPVRGADETRGVDINGFVAAEKAVRLRDWETITRLAPHHPWAGSVVRDRFSYSEKLEADCLSVAFVRVYRLESTWHLPYERRFGGCRSWVDLPEPPPDWEASMCPVISDAEHARRAEAITPLLG